MFRPAATGINEFVDAVTKSAQSVLASLPRPPAPNCPHMEWQAATASSSGSRPPIPSWGSFPKDDEIKVSVRQQAIKDTYTLKKSVDIATISGAINIDIIPSPTPSNVFVRKLHTETISGAQKCSLTSSLGPFLLDSSHMTTSGAIKLSYPVDWSGTIELFLTSGGYKLDSAKDDVRVIRDIWDSTAGCRKIFALKGNPKEGEEFSTMKIKSISGAIKVGFDEKPPLRDMTAAELNAEEEEYRRENAKLGKQERERNGPAVTRSATTETTDTPPPAIPHGHQENRNPSGSSDLPPSYEQSEAENVLAQLAGRD